MITCMNSGLNNMSRWEAAELAGLIKPKVAIPCHYDMFPDNAADPQLFRAALRYKAPDVRYQQLEYVKPFVFKSWKVASDRTVLLCDQGAPPGRRRRQHVRFGDYQPIGFQFSKIGSSHGQCCLDRGSFFFAHHKSSHSGNRWLPADCRFAIMGVQRNECPR